MRGSRATVPVVFLVLPSSCRYDKTILAQQQSKKGATQQTAKKVDSCIVQCHSGHMTGANSLELLSHVLELLYGILVSVVAMSSS